MAKYIYRNVLNGKYGEPFESEDKKIKVPPMCLLYKVIKVPKKQTDIMNSWKEGE